MKTSNIPASVSWLYREAPKWNHSPSYQRAGRQWSMKQKQLFIDSLLNGFPIPPIFIHRMRDGGKAVIDGKQRLETLREFIDGEFGLADDFILLDEFDGAGGAPRRCEGFNQFASGWKSKLLGADIPMIEVEFAREEDADALVRQIFLRINNGTKVSSKHLDKVKQELQQLQEVMA